MNACESACACETLLSNLLQEGVSSYFSGEQKGLILVRLSLGLALGGQPGRSSKPMPARCFSLENMPNIMLMFPSTTSTISEARSKFEKIDYLLPHNQ